MIWNKLTKLYVIIKWNPWNPWCLGVMNLAWQKYTKTSMYKERKELEASYPVDFYDFAYRAYINNCEIQYFAAHFTTMDKIKILLMPFSFGNTFQMPFQRLGYRIFGV